MLSLLYAKFLIFSLKFLISRIPYSSNNPLVLGVRHRHHGRGKPNIECSFGLTVSNPKCDIFLFKSGIDAKRKEKIQGNEKSKRVES